ncbi:hypothetical protein EJ06DRAFT_65146 [Trichodelitschia bisporula]|uniref:Uncharacterized protein n=1 Tax=Trichodelitschia bisporula TaxID=703511 RepID=A0A6G1HSF2_9PEZI|nr:hypothetical protein EJ06DRAFT_65146 [Trichodelitschia bisporula]
MRPFSSSGSGLMGGSSRLPVMGCYRSFMRIRGLLARRTRNNVSEVKLVLSFSVFLGTGGTWRWWLIELSMGDAYLPPHRCRSSLSSPSGLSAWPFPSTGLPLKRRTLTNCFEPKLAADPTGSFVFNYTKSTQSLVNSGLAEFLFDRIEKSEMGTASTLTLNSPTTVIHSNPPPHRIHGFDRLYIGRAPPQNTFQASWPLYHCS